MTSRPPRFRHVPGILCSFALATALPAATIVPIADEALVDAAPVILIGRVEGKLPPVSAALETEWLITVERVLKADRFVGGSLVLVTPGGVNARGEWSKVFGAPVFRRGERVLLFARAAAGDRFAALHLLEGAFHLRRVAGREYAVRDLSEVRLAVRRRKPRPRWPTPRDATSFLAWIEDRVAGEPRARDYRTRAPRRALRALTREFTLLGGDGPHYRWFQFDSGQSVPWRLSGSMGGLSGGGHFELPAAIAAWNTESHTPIRYVSAGVTDAAAPLSVWDGQNVILFGDPNSEVEGYDCATGGLLGYATVKSNSTAEFDGRTFRRIGEADVVINDGIECLVIQAPDSGKFVEELLAHELGHTLGIGHSSENPEEGDAALRQALMYYRIGWDGAGAQLFPDDTRALQTLYRPGGAAPPPPPPPPPGGCPADTLCLLDGRFRVTATWENQYNNTSGVAGVPRRNSALPASFYNLSGFLYFTDPGNIELIVKVLDFGSVVKVFYGQLTDLRFTLTVTDTRSGDVKTYRNTAGNCGGFDDNGFPSAAVQTILKSTGSNPHTAGSSHGTCQADADTMCLNDDRFAVEMTWRNQYNDTSGTGIPTRLSNLTGAFSFTSRANLETLIKVLEFPDRFLVLYGALSNLEYTFQLRDTVTGRTETYHNPAGRYCGGLDNSAF